MTEFAELIVTDEQNCQGRARTATHKVIFRALSQQAPNSLKQRAPSARCFLCLERKPSHNAPPTEAGSFTSRGYLHPRPAAAATVTSTAQADLSHLWSEKYVLLRKPSVCCYSQSITRVVLSLLAAPREHDCRCNRNAALRSPC